MERVHSPTYGRVLPTDYTDLYPEVRRAGAAFSQQESNMAPPVGNSRLVLLDVNEWRNGEVAARRLYRQPGGGG